MYTPPLTPQPLFPDFHPTPQEANRQTEFITSTQHITSPTLATCRALTLPAVNSARSPLNPTLLAGVIRDMELGVSVSPRLELGLLEEGFGGGGWIGIGCEGYRRNS